VEFSLLISKDFLQNESLVITYFMHASLLSIAFVKQCKVWGRRAGKIYLLENFGFDNICVLLHSTCSMFFSQKRDREHTLPIVWLVLIYAAYFRQQCPAALWLMAFQPGVLIILSRRESGLNTNCGHTGKSTKIFIWLITQTNNFASFK
jgi:hypothetical protein